MITINEIIRLQHFLYILHIYDTFLVFQNVNNTVKYKTQKKYKKKYNGNLIYLYQKLKIVLNNVFSI